MKSFLLLFWYKKKIGQQWGLLSGRGVVYNRERYACADLFYEKIKDEIQNGLSNTEIFSGCCQGAEFYKSSRAAAYHTAYPFQTAGSSGGGTGSEASGAVRKKYHINRSGNLF